MSQLFLPLAVSDCFFVDYFKMDISSLTTPLQRKLACLGYHTPLASFTDHAHLKSLVIWLEDQKIRHYKIEEREPLRDETGDNWDKVFKEYLADMQCPFSPDSASSTSSCLQWLTDEALRCEFTDASNTRQGLCSGLRRHDNQKAGGTTPNSALNISSSDPVLKRGVEALAKTLQITTHVDPTVLLAACRLVIEEKLSDEALKKASDEEKERSKRSPPSSKKPKHHNVTPKQCGFDLGDPVLGEAAKTLRLLHIKELRELQTKINELIVAVQNITADPKTDSSLGKVGR